MAKCGGPDAPALLPALGLTPAVWCCPNSCGRPVGQTTYGLAGQTLSPWASGNFAPPFKYTCYLHLAGWLYASQPATYTWPDRTDTGPLLRIHDAVAADAVATATDWNEWWPGITDTVTANHTPRNLRYYPDPGWYQDGAWEG